MNLLHGPFSPLLSIFYFYHSLSILSSTSFFFPIVYLFRVHIVLMQLFYDNIMTLTQAFHRIPINLLSAACRPRASNQPPFTMSVYTTRQ